MIIKIVTDGDSHNTRLFINDEEVEWDEFDIMASKIKRGAGVKMQLTRPAHDGRRKEFCSYYKGDFKKMDEVCPRRSNGK
jgi:hypothetical protein